MKVLLFGVLAEAAGKSEVKMSASDINSLKENLYKEFPHLKNYSFQIAVNKEKVQMNASLNNDDEVALLPPFAGG